MRMLWQNILANRCFSKVTILVRQTSDRSLTNHDHQSSPLRRSFTYSDFRIPNSTPPPLQFPVSSRTSDLLRNRRFGAVAPAAADQGDRRPIVRLPETVKGHLKIICQKIELGNAEGRSRRRRRIENLSRSCY